MRVTVWGSGYVGLVTGACLADAGNHVICVDIDPDKIRALASGIVPIYEPGLQSVIRRNIRAKRLDFTIDPAKGAQHGLLQLIAVGTPRGEDGSADLRHVLTVANTIGENLDHYSVVVTKSTVPVGTTDLVRSGISTALSRRNAPLRFDVASNPEFLKEGTAVADFMKPDRIVVGADNPDAIQLLRALYAPFTRNHDRLIVMAIRSAELTKYAANAMLATKISFMNELAQYAECVGADIESVRVGIGSDPRIGYSFIYAGAGYGGSCFPKDVQAQIRSARNAGCGTRILEAVDATNREQKLLLARKISRHFRDSLLGVKIALWGLAFKANTDDMRAAPSLAVIDYLLSQGATVQAYDPAAMEEAHRLLGARPGFNLASGAYQALQGADALAIVTDWREFRSPDFIQIRSMLKHPVIFDGRNLYSPELLQQQGFTYYAIGRPQPSPELISRADSCPSVAIRIPRTGRS